MPARITESSKKKQVKPRARRSLKKAVTSPDIKPVIIAFHFPCLVYVGQHPRTLDGEMASFAKRTEMLLPEELEIEGRVCLLKDEQIEQLVSEGYPIFPDDHKTRRNFTFEVNYDSKAHCTKLEYISENPKTPRDVEDFARTIIANLCRFRIIVKHPPPF
jgi:hypothetical protein